MKGEKASRGKRTSGKREVGVRQGITRGGSRIFKRGGAPTSAEGTSFLGRCGDMPPPRNL